LRVPSSFWAAFVLDFTDEPLIINSMLSQIDQEEAYFYCCLWPRVTGLPMRVWVPDAAAEDENLRAQISHTAESLPNDVALVNISEEPRVIEGELQESDFAAVRAFVKRNLGVLRAHRNGQCDSGDLVCRLKR
jgi:hypothetical protein